MQWRLHRGIWLGLFVCHNAAALPTVAATVTAAASTLDLDGEGSSETYIVKVADVTFSTDNATGCTLTLSSGDIAKAGGLNIAYKVTSVADGAAAPTSGDFTVPTGTDYTYAISSATSSDRDVYVKYTTRSIQDPGTYSETIHFTVADT